MTANKIIARTLKIVDKMDQEDSKWNQGHPYQQKDRVPVLLLSHPGYGKTSTVRKWCLYMDYNLYTLIPSRHSADDILGFEVKLGAPGHEQVKRMTPSWYNAVTEMAQNGKRTVLFVEEISTCDPYVQGPLLDLIFSRSLGEYSLPENTMVIAAGNYPEDLHNAFEMNEALVNRHLILNLYRKDFSIAEQLQGTFGFVQSREDIEKFFGLKPEIPSYDIVRFKEWVLSSKEITYSKESKYTYDPEFGLRGYTSPRSLDFALRFAEAYTEQYSDKYWMRIVGDTLGSSEKRDGKPLRTVLESASEEYFKRQEVKLSDNDTLGSVCDEISRSATANAGVPSPEIIQKLVDLVKGNSNLKFSSSELANFAGVVPLYAPKYPVLKELASILAERVRANSTSNSNPF